MGISDGVLQKFHLNVIVGRGCGGRVDGQGSGTQQISLHRYTMQSIIAVYYHTYTLHTDEEETESGTDSMEWVELRVCPERSVGVSNPPCFSSI